MNTDIKKGFKHCFMYLKTLQYSIINLKDKFNELYQLHDY